MASPQKEPQVLSLIRFTGQKNRTHVAHFCCWLTSVLLVSPQEEECEGKPARRFFQILPRSSFPVCNNSATTTNLRQVNSYMLSPRPPSGDPLTVT